MRCGAMCWGVMGWGGRLREVREGDGLGGIALVDVGMTFGGCLRNEQLWDVRGCIFGFCFVDGVCEMIYYKVRQNSTIVV